MSETALSPSPSAASPASAAPRPKPAGPVLVAIDMGYGHLRPAAALAERLGTPVQLMDGPPLGDEHDQLWWRRTRKLYEPLSRWTQLPLIGRPAQALLDLITAIPPLYPARDRSAPNAGTKALVRAARSGIGRALAAHLEKEDAPLLTTFYAAAVITEVHGRGRIGCVVTDSDVNRAWAPADPATSRIVYFAPAAHTARRLRSYGVKPENLRITGFPLPHELLGGPGLEVAKRNLAARLVRLDPGGAFLDAHSAELERVLGPLPAGARGRPPLLTFAVGGAGAQVGLVAEFLPSLKRLIGEGRLRLALVAGRRAEVAARLRGFLADAGLAEGEAVSVLEAPDFAGYLARFNRLLAETDVLWTKPSEMTFFAALGLPLVTAPPVGVHEGCNRRWAEEWGAALPQGDLACAADWLRDWIDDGVLAAAAWAGFRHLPNRGVYRIAEEMGRI